MMNKIYVLFIFLIFLSGCSATQPAMIEYKLSLKKLDSSSLSSNGCRKKSLRVSQAFSQSSLMSLNMNYMIDKSKIYAYSQAQWSNSPNQEITSQIVQLLREAKLFKTTQSSKSSSRSEFILESTIEDFMQYYNKDITSSYVNIVINMTLIDFKTHNVVASKTFSKRMKTNSLDAEGGVIALNKALKNVLEDSIKFFNEVCK